MTDYQMFTKQGNAAVQEIVSEALVLAGLDGTSNAAEQAWQWALSELDALSKLDGCEEATDTVVREAVYKELVF